MQTYKLKFISQFTAERYETDETDPDPNNWITTFVGNVSTTLVQQNLAYSKHVSAKNQTGKNPNSFFGFWDKITRGDDVIEIDEA